MESRPAPLRSRRVCRFCLTESEPLNYIYERDNSRPFNVPLTLQIMSCVAIEAYLADGMPQMICTMCRWNLDRSYKFKQQCRKADEALRAYPMTGTLPRPFPPMSGETPEIGSSSSSNKRALDQQQQQQQQQRSQSEVVTKKPRVDNGDREQQQQQQQTSQATPSTQPRGRGRPPRHVAAAKAAAAAASTTTTTTSSSTGAATGAATATTPSSMKTERSDNYRVTRRISEGEKKRPDSSIQSRKMGKFETDSDDEEEDDEHYSNSEDEYKPPELCVKQKSPKSTKREIVSKYNIKPDKEQRKENYVVLRNKDGELVKTIKTIMPKQPQQQQQQQHEVAETRTLTATTPVQRTNVVNKEQVKETTTTPAKVQTMQTIKRVKVEASATPSVAAAAAATATTTTPKSVNTVKVIKRIVVRKPTGAAETTTTTTTTKDGETTKTSTPASGTKVKRTIIRRIIRQGDTTREVMLNADGTPIDPAELAKLPIGNVVKRVILKKPAEKTQSTIEQSSAPESKTEVKTPKINTSSDKKAIAITKVEKVEKKVTVSSPNPAITKSNNETSERVLQLEKQLETQRLVIEELQAKKQQEYETNDDMLPDRHDSEDEQELPLKRVFVKRKQSIYDEERAYNDVDTTNLKKEISDTPAIIVPEQLDEQESPETMIENNKTPTDFDKIDEAPGDDDISRELSSILESTDGVVKMQENVLNNLTEISDLPDGVRQMMDDTKQQEIDEQEKQQEQSVEMMDIETNNDEVAVEKNTNDERLAPETEQPIDTEMKEIEDVTQQPEEQPPKENNEVKTVQDLNESGDLFDTSDACPKSEQSLDDSVIAISQTNETINLNDTNDSQDSLEDKLSQMEG